MEERHGLSIKDFCRSIGISRSLVYELIAAGSLKMTKIAGRSIIPSGEAARIVREGAPVPPRQGAHSPPP